MGDRLPPPIPEVYYFTFDGYPIPTLPEEKEKPDANKWRIIGFSNNGIGSSFLVHEDDELYFFNRTLNNQSDLDSRPERHSHDIFFPDSGNTTYDSISYLFRNRSEVRIDPGFLYQITISNHPDIENTSPGSSSRQGTVLFSGESEHLVNMTDPVSEFWVSSGRQFGVNVSFSLIGPAGYHLKIFNETDDLIFNITDWQNLPSGFSLKSDSHQVTIDPHILPDKPLRFVLNQVLSVSGIDPRSSVPDSNTVFRITGTGFHQGDEVFLMKTGEYSQAGLNVTITSPVSLTCQFPLSDITPGFWDLGMRKGDESFILPDALFIKKPIVIPVITDLDHVISDSLSAISAPFSKFIGDVIQTVDEDTGHGDFGITQLSDPFHLTIKLKAMNPNMDSPKDGKYRSDLHNSGVYDDGGIRPDIDEFWSFEVDTDTGSGPVVVNKTVYFGSGPGVYALDALTGHKEWQFLTDDKVYSTPAVNNNTLYVGSSDSCLYALDALSGQMKWKMKTGEAIYTSPAVINRTVIFGSSDSYVYAISVDDGHILWSREIPGSTSPAIDNDLAYVGSIDSFVYALDTDTGEIVWRYQTGGPIQSTPAIGYGMVYIGSDDNLVHAIDARLGIEKWRFQTGSYVMSSPAVSDGVVYIGSGDTWVYAIDALTGERRWMCETGKDVRSSPIFSNGIVYVKSDDSRLYALNTKNGPRIRWMLKTDDSYDISGLAIGYGLLYLRDGGTMKALGNSPEFRIF